MDDGDGFRGSDGDYIHGWSTGHNNKLHLRKLTSDIVALQIGDDMAEIAGSASDSEVMTSAGM